MLLAEVSFTPLDKGSSVSAWVAKVIDVIDASGLPYRVCPMGTCLEGEWDEVMAVLSRCFAVLEGECDRISITFKGDWRRGYSGRLDSKIDRVQERLGRAVRRG